MIELPLFRQTQKIAEQGMTAFRENGFRMKLHPVKIFPVKRGAILNYIICCCDGVFAYCSIVTMYKIAVTVFRDTIAGETILSLSRRDYGTGKLNPGTSLDKCTLCTTLEIWSPSIRSIAPARKKGNFKDVRPVKNIFQKG